MVTETFSNRERSKLAPNIITSTVVSTTGLIPRKLVVVPLHKIRTGWTLNQNA